MKGVGVPRQPTVALGRKALSAAHATVGNGPELYHLPADRSRRDDKIEGALASRLQVLGPPFRVEGDDVLALAGGAAGRRDFHPVGHPQVPVFPASALCLAVSPSLCGLRSHEHMTALVIEIRPLIDKFEISMRKLSPGRGPR
jgi:hypothetical protein